MLLAVASPVASVVRDFCSGAHTQYDDTLGAAVIVDSPIRSLE
jgi:hypothetical protein